MTGVRIPVGASPSLLRVAVFVREWILSNLRVIGGQDGAFPAFSVTVASQNRTPLTAGYILTYTALM